MIAQHFGKKVHLKSSPSTEERRQFACDAG
jgi:hypothetical protein